VVLSSESIRLFPSTRPKDIGIKDGDKLKVYTVDQFTNQQETIVKISINIVFTSEKYEHQLQPIQNGKKQFAKKFKVVIAVGNPIRPVFEHVSRHLGVRSEDIVLEFKGAKLYILSIPKNVGIEEGSEIFGFFHAEYEEIVKRRLMERAHTESGNSPTEQEERIQDKRIKVKISLEDQVVAFHVLPVIEKLIRPFQSKKLYHYCSKSSNWSEM
jgi:hypothetical protein